MKAIFLDIETTGLDAGQHEAIDIAFKIVDLSQAKVVKTYESLIDIGAAAWEKRDLKSIEINGYTWEEVSQGKTKEKVAAEIIALFKEAEIVRHKAVYICQNPSFDRAFFSKLIDVYRQESFNWPYHWLDFASMYWALLVKECQQKGIRFPEELNLSKNAIAKIKGLNEEESPHHALRGVEHLMACYEAVVGFKGSLDG